jgi:hypothetical protein
MIGSRSFGRLMVDRMAKKHSQLKGKLDAPCSDIAAHLDASGTTGGIRSAADEVSYRSHRLTGGRQNWRGRVLWVLRTISDTRSSPRRADWCSTTWVPSPSTKLAITALSA